MAVAVLRGNFVGCVAQALAARGGLLLVGTYLIAAGILSLYGVMLAGHRFRNVFQ